MAAPPDALTARWRSGSVRGRGLIGAACLFGVAMAAYLSYRGATGPMRDLEVYRDGAFAIRRGQDLYQMISGTGLLYTYPPVGAILAVPLSLVPFGAAKLVWVLVMVCVPLGVACWFGFRPLLARASRSGGAAAGVAAFAAAVGCGAVLFPVRQEFYFGQVDLFLVALCVLDFAVPNPRWPRGLLIGLATAIKLEPGVFIVYLLLTRRRKEAAVAAVSSAAWTALAWLVSPHDSVSYWTDEIFQGNRIGGPGSAANQSLRGMILRVFKPHPAPVAAWLAVAAIVAVAGFFMARSCWRRGDDTAGIAITGLLAAALSPVAWIHHYCWVVVAIGVILGAGRSGRRIGAAIAALAVFATMLPVQAEHMITRGSMPAFPGRELEDSFGLVALLLIVIIWRPPPATGQERSGNEVASGAQEQPAWPERTLVPPSMR
jgi:alpha-1,2-mannosyltransferase